MSAEREFLDANVLVYAFDPSAGPKHHKAQALVERLWKDNRGCLSVQILQEFYVTVTRKVPIPLTPQQASDLIRDFAVWNTFSPKTSDILAAIQLHRENQMSFWDAMVVHAAAELGCTLLWTEDLHDGQTLRGVTLRNPFS